VVHLLEDIDIHVAKVAGKEEGDDLPLSIGELLIAAGPSVEHEMDVARLVALGHEVAAWLDDADVAGDSREGRLVVGGQPGECFEF
jgi:hypothetical protein